MGRCAADLDTRVQLRLEGYETGIRLMHDAELGYGWAGPLDVGDTQAVRVAAPHSPDRMGERRLATVRSGL